LGVTTKLRLPIAIVLVIAVTLSGCGPASARPGDQQPPPPSAPIAQRQAPALLSVATPATPSNAFVEGYRAYRNHDLATAIDRLAYASDHFPQLGDYAVFYLGLAQRDSGDLAASAKSFDRLIRNYPESVTAPDGAAALADVYFRLARPNDAASMASRAIATTSDAKTEQSARWTLARALAAEGNPRGAYNELMEQREKYPRGQHDADARNLAYSILVANPEIANVNSVEHHRDEAELLLKEGAPSLALREISAALAMEPTRSVRAEFIFMKATALKGNAEQAEAAFGQYLELAPTGASAPAAMEALALIYWHREERDRARAQFNRLIARFPKGHYAPGAMLRIGRIFEEDDKYDLARAEYASLIARHPSSESADDARFRLPWSYYMGRRYGEAANSFAAMREHPGSEAGSRDMLIYWEARAKEKSGDGVGARTLYEICASSIDSNYYPELASRRVAAASPDLPAAGATDPHFDPDFAMQAGAASFHVERVLALRALGLKELEPAEFKQLENHANGIPGLRSFVLAGLQSAGAYYDAIVMAGRMEKLGELTHPVAERIRYPRAYWDLIGSHAAQKNLDPYLVLSLARQESWFNPEADSVSDARGLMQLLPSTANRMIRENGVAIAEPPDLFDPDINVELGTLYLKQLLAMFNGNEIRAVAAYNAGEHAVVGWNEKFPGDDDEWVENIGYHETREYVKRVIGNQREYRMLYSTAPRAPSS
jgi:soluble lytic murein transglycosylase